MSEWETIGSTKGDGWETISPVKKGAPVSDPVGNFVGAGSLAIPGGVASVEPALAMASGMLAKPASDVAGLAALIPRAFGVGPDPMSVKQRVQNAMSYQPRTQVGQAMTEWNPLALLGRGVNWAAEGYKNIVAPPQTSGPLQSAFGAGAEEAFNQIPGFLGFKAPVAANAMKQGSRSLAEWTMEKALKPSFKDATERFPGTTMSEAEVAGQTMLDEGLNVSKGGVEAMRDRVFELNDAIKQKIESSPVLVSQPALMAKVSAEMQGLLDKFVKQAGYTTDLAAIQKAWNEMMQHPLLQGPDVPVQTLQDIKQGTYRSLGDKAYPGGQVAGSTAAEKAVARIAKDEVANAVPEVRALNAEESKYLNALTVVERRALSEANKNLVGLGWLTTNPIHFAAWMADRSSLFKSLVARMVNAGSKATPSMDIAGPVSGAIVSQDRNTMSLGANNQNAMAR
jgi:hypothetical protein